mgnify:CR=1 FL=1
MGKYFSVRMLEDENIQFVGKCLYIEEHKQKILVIGDLHLGYEEVLNRGGVFISRAMFKEMIAYFERVFERVGKVNKIVLLGDVKHAFGNIMEQEWDDVLRLFDYLKKKLLENGKIIIVKGNHDRILEPIAKLRNMVELKPYFIFHEFFFMHGDKDFFENYEKKIKYWIIGHGHPAITIRDPEGIKAEKYKCFLTGHYKKKRIIEAILVPSFFAYTEGSDPRENDLGFPWKFDFERFFVHVVGDSLDVLDFGRLGKLK